MYTGAGIACGVLPPTGCTVEFTVGEVIGVGVGVFAAVRASSALRELAWAAFLSRDWVAADFCTGVSAVLATEPPADVDEGFDVPKDPNEVLLGEAGAAEDFDEVDEEDDDDDDEDEDEDDEELEDEVLPDEKPPENDLVGLP